MDDSDKKRKRKLAMTFTVINAIIVIVGGVIAIKGYIDGKGVLLLGGGFVAVVAFVLMIYTIRIYNKNK